MKFDGFSYRVSADVTLTAADLVTLFEVASIHYDGKCKALARRKAKGSRSETEGWIVRTMDYLLAEHDIDNSFNLEPEELVKLCKANPELTREVTLDFHHMDTLSKTMEVANYMQNPPVELFWGLNQAFKQVQAEIRRLSGR